MKVYNEIKTIWYLAYPMILSSLVQLLFGLGDQAIIGRVNVEGYAAVGVVSNSIYVLTGSIGIFGVVFNILGAKALGEKNHKAFADYFNISITISILIGLSFYFISLLFGKYFLAHFFGLTGKTLRYGQDYLYIAGLSLGLNSILFVFCSYFKNIFKTKIIFWATLISGLINLLIDYTLVFGKWGFPRLEAKGAAIGSVIGLALTVLIYSYVFYRTKNFKFRLKLESSILKRFSKIYFPMAFQDLLEYTAFAFILTAIIARLGTYHLATYNLLSALINIIILPVYAFAGASLTIVSKAKGESNDSKVKRTPLSSSLMAYFFFLILGSLLILFPGASSSIITNDQKIIEQTISIMLIGLMPQLFNIGGQVIKNSLFAIGEEKWTFYYSLVVSISSLALTYYLAIYKNLGLEGIFSGLTIYYLVLILGYSLKYYRPRLISKELYLALLNKLS